MYFPAIQSEYMYHGMNMLPGAVERHPLTGRRIGMACSWRVRQTRAVLAASAADVIGLAL
jgi:hypothetical protein